MAALIAAAIHDVDHPGRNNSFLVNTSDKLAILYNDDSVLENHHLAVSFQLLQESSQNFLENLKSTQVKALRKMIIDMVLATDMQKHFHQLGALKTKVETKKVVNDGYLMLEKYEERFEVCLIRLLLHDGYYDTHTSTIFGHCFMYCTFANSSSFVFGYVLCRVLHCHTSCCSIVLTITKLGLIEP